MTLLAPPAPAGTARGPRPQFSVVIAAYQAESTIAESVRSALEQDESPHEVVVCDDGSTDGTADVLRGLVAAHGSRVRVVTQANGGVARARNKAIRSATSEWVAVLDADDLFLPGRLTALADAIQDRPDLDVVVTDAYEELDGQRIRRVYREGFTFPVADQRKVLFEDNRILNLVAARRSRLLEVGAYDEEVRVTSDWACWLRMLVSGSTFGLIDEPLAVYRITENSVSASPLGLLAGRVRTLERTAALEGLTEQDREWLAASLGHHRRALQLEQARSALVGRAPDRRARSLAVARTVGHSPQTRVKALWAAALPGSAARRLDRPAAQAVRAQAYRNV